MHRQSIGGYSRAMGDDLTQAVYALAGPLSLAFVSSIVQASAALIECNVLLNSSCTNFEGYSASLGFISTILILGFFICFFFAHLRAKLPEKFLYYFSVFLLLWWGVGVCVTTFQVTVIPDTKYFMTWLGFFTSALIAYSEFEQFSLLIDRLNTFEVYFQSTLYLIIFSIVEMISSIVYCTTLSCSSNSIFGIVIGASSFILCIIFLKTQHVDEISNKLIVFLCLLWTVGFCVLSLSGPFRYAGNGFFSSLACFILTFYIAQSKLFPFSSSFVASYQSHPHGLKKSAQDLTSANFASDNPQHVNKKSHAFILSNPGHVDESVSSSASGATGLYNSDMPSNSDQQSIREVV